MVKLSGEHDQSSYTLEHRLALGGQSQGNGDLFYDCKRSSLTSSVKKHGVKWPWGHFGLGFFRVQMSCTMPQFLTYRTIGQ